MSAFTKVDNLIVYYAQNYFSVFARVSLCIIFFYFGLLKVIGLSPANELAIGFAEKMGTGAIALELFYILAFVECLIGILILVPRFTKLAIGILFVHMAVVCAPIVFYPEATWESFLVPNLEGQYVIKNLAIIALAVELIAETARAKH